MLPAGVREWRDAGSYVPTSAGSVFVASAAGAAPRVLLLHGYPSSSYDFRHVVARLGQRAWLTLDFPGFGLSEKPRSHTYSLFEHADVVEQVVAATTTGSLVLVAHDMGTSVATELMARDIEGRLGFALERAVLSNGSVLVERASLRLSQKVLRGPWGPLAARLTNRRMFVREFAALFSPTHPLAAVEAEAQWALLSRAGGHRIVHRLTRYLHERVRHATRWHGAVRDWDKPLGLLWGLLDPVATIAVLDGLRALRPEAGLVELPGLGHYPQLEDPDAFTAGALRLLGL
jgi:pimeloyl-ACP methyl ester carboxylesterase